MNNQTAPRPVEEKGFHPIKKFNNWMKNNELIKSEKNNLASVRVKLTYFVAIIWTLFVLSMLRLVSNILGRIEPEQKAQVIGVIMTSMVNIFYVISFIFFIILMIYVLKRNKFSFKAWGIELNVDSVDDKNAKPVEPPKEV